MDSTAIAAGFVACRNWEWMDGMLVRSYALAGVGGPYERLRITGPKDVKVLGGEVFPDVEDPATRGCILELLRKTCNRPDLHITSVVTISGEVRWWPDLPNGSYGLIDTALDISERTETEAMLRFLQIYSTP
jgi:hypothetical protein